MFVIFIVNDRFLLLNIYVVLVIDIIRLIVAECAVINMCCDSLARQWSSLVLLFLRLDVSILLTTIVLDIVYCYYCHCHVCIYVFNKQQLCRMGQQAADLDNHRSRRHGAACPSKLMTIGARGRLRSKTNTSPTVGHVLLLICWLLEASVWCPSGHQK